MLRTFATNRSTNPFYITMKIVEGLLKTSDLAKRNNVYNGEGRGVDTVTKTFPTDFNMETSLTPVNPLVDSREDPVRPITEIISNPAESENYFRLTILHTIGIDINKLPPYIQIHIPKLWIEVSVNLQDLVKSRNISNTDLNVAVTNELNNAGAVYPRET